MIKTPNKSLSLSLSLSLSFESMSDTLCPLALGVLLVHGVKPLNKLASSFSPPPSLCRAAMTRPALSTLKLSSHSRSLARDIT